MRKTLIFLFTFLLTIGFAVCPVQAAPEFDRENIRQIEITDLKPDYWPNQYFTPEDSVFPLKVRLTDSNGITKEVKYNEFAAYHLSLYIPKGMEELIHTVTVGNTKKFILSADPVQNLVLGVRYDLDESVFAETDPKGQWNTRKTSFPNHYGIFTHIGSLPATFIKVFRADDSAKKQIESVPVSTEINITIKIPGRPGGFADLLFLKVPGVEQMVELKKTTIDGVAVYANVDRSGSQKFVPIVPERPTKTKDLADIPNVKRNLSAFGKSLPLEILPKVIDRNKDTKAPIEGQEDYVRIVFNAQEGSFASGSKDKVYDVLKSADWDGFIKESPVPSALPPQNKVFTGWAPALPDAGAQISGLGGNSVTIGDKSIRLVTYNALYTDIISEGDESVQPGQDFVRLIFNSGEGSFDNGIKKKLLDVYKGIHWNDSNLISRIRAIERTVIPQQDKIFAGWDLVIPETDESVSGGSYTARYLDKITVTPPAAEDMKKYLELTFEDGLHGAVSSDMWKSGGEKKVWLLSDARKTFGQIKEFLGVRVVPEETYSHTGWSGSTATVLTDESVIEVSMTARAEYKEKKVTIPVIKEWTHRADSDPLPDAVDLSLYRKVTGEGGSASRELLQTVKIRPDADGVWKGQFTDVALSADYILEENPINGYEMSWTNEGSLQAPAFKVTNRKLPALTIINTLPGLFSDHQKEFLIRVSLTKGGKAVSGAYDYSKGEESGQLTFSDAGLAEIRLKHGQSITIKNLPADAAYRVEEDVQSARGYTVTYKEADSGSLTEDTKVEVINTGQDIVATGIKENAAAASAMALALILVFSLMTAFVKFKEKKSFIKRL